MTSDNTDLMDYANIHTKALELINEKPKLYQRIIILKPRIDTLGKILNNLGLFGGFWGKFGNPEGQPHTVYDDAEKALKDYKLAIANRVLIHMVDLGLYAVATYAQYADYVKITRMSSLINGTPTPIVHQLVLASQPHKFVFINTEASAMQAVVKYARDCFGAGVSTCGDEITVSVMINSEGTNDAFTKICNHAIRVGDMDCARALNTIITITGDIHYKSFDLTDLFDEESTADPLMGLKTLPSPPTANANGNNNVNANLVNNANGPLGMQASAVRWIGANPPGDHEATMAYYARYLAANPDGLSGNRFGPVVSSCGYIVKQGTAFRYWDGKH